MGAAEKEGETRQPTQVSISQHQFLAWKRQKDAELLAKQAEAARKRQEDIASGRVPMNGRELFLHQPWVFDDESPSHHH